MKPLTKGFLGTQVLAALFGTSYFALLAYRRNPDALNIGLRIWGYFAGIFLLLQAFLAVKQWWENSRRQ